METKNKHHSLPEGKPTPLRVPEGFFSDFDKRLAGALSAEGAPGQSPDAEALALLPRRRPLIRMWVPAAAAAAVALLFLARPLVGDLGSHHPSLSVEQAYSQLSDADRQTLMDNYDYMFSADDGTF